MFKKIVLISLISICFTGCIKLNDDVVVLVDETDNSETVENDLQRPLFETGVIRIETLRGEYFDINVEIAETQQEQSYGLMYVDKLEENEGMWFPYNQERALSFWMKNTLVPLDILFVNKDFEIVDIKENFLPCKAEDCESYTALAKAQYVLEVIGEYSEINDINIGDKIYPILMDE